MRSAMRLRAAMHVLQAMCYIRPMKTAVLALVALLAGCAQSTSVPQQDRPDHRIRVVSTSCSPNYGRPRADVAIQNIGQTTMEWPKVMVEFGGQVHDGHLSPRPLRPGAISTATLYAAKGESDSCSVVSVVGEDGFPAAISR